MQKAMKRIAGMVLILLVIFLLVGVGEFLYLYNNGLSGLYNNTKPETGQIKVACVGDSITYGHSVSGWGKNHYPAVLQDILGEAYHVANFGVSGACINKNGNKPYIKRTVYEESIKYDADVLVFMLGSNDSKPKNWIDMETFLEQYGELLNTYLQKEKRPKVYIGICAKAYYVDGVKSGTARYNIRPDIVDQIATALKEKYEQEDVVIVDIHELTEKHSEWFEKDGVHPNKDGARAIANKVAELILKAHKENNS